MAATKLSLAGGDLAALDVVALALLRTVGPGGTGTA